MSDARPLSELSAAELRSIRALVDELRAMRTTPAPWRAHDDGWITAGGDDDCEVCIAQMDVDNCGREVYQADARLIAEAPRLLNLLAALVSRAERGERDTRDAERWRAVKAAASMEDGERMYTSEHRPVAWLEGGAIDCCAPMTADEYADALVHGPRGLRAGPRTREREPQPSDDRARLLARHLPTR